MRSFFRSFLIFNFLFTLFMMDHDGLRSEYNIFIKRSTLFGSIFTQGGRDASIAPAQHDTYSRSCSSDIYMIYFLQIDT